MKSKEMWHCSVKSNFLAWNMLERLYGLLERKESVRLIMSFMIELIKADKIRRRERKEKR